MLAYEALIRPPADFGLAGPMQAFDIADRLGRVADLDRLCLERILADAGGIPGDALLFVNLSPGTLAHPTFSAAALARCVDANGLARERIVFEVTERSTVAPERLAAGVAALQAEGFRVGLDDVGAGNSGLEMLRKVPFEYVKVDRSVVVGALEGGTGRAALIAILAFARESGARVIVEGIEDGRMLEMIDEFAHGFREPRSGLIHGLQGFFLGRPQPGFVAPGRRAPSGSEAA